MQLAWLLLSCLLLGLSMIRPPYPLEQALQHAPTLVATVVLGVAARRRWLSNSSFACLIAFWLLHLVGARYIYSYVPYDDWLTWLTGGSLRGYFGWTRNRSQPETPPKHGLFQLVLKMQRVKTDSGDAKCVNKCK